MAQEYVSSNQVGEQSESPKSLRDQATETACKMLLDGAMGRQNRFNDIKKNEDQYFGVQKPALRGRSNIPFDSVVMGGFIDTLLAGTNQDVHIQYGHTREQDKISADKVSAVWEREAGPDRGDWNTKFNDSKLMAALSGVGFTKLFATNTPKFATDLEVCDHYDMIVEPTGGPDIDKHLYKFQMNIFRTKEQLMEMANKGFYDKLQVRKLITTASNPETQKEYETIFNNKQIRYATFGIDVATMGYVGQRLYRLTEGVINYNSKWYYIVFSLEAKLAVRFQPLEEVFEYAKIYPGRGPWRMWQTHRHPFLAWSKAPADDVRPVAYTMKKLVNLMIDNLEKRNWDMTAYDPKVFTDPTQLLWKQDGLARATLKNGASIESGIFKFTTPDTASVTINVIEWLNNFVGQKTGITPDSQGASQTDRVGILVSNIEQTTKRLTMLNTRFSKMIVDLGVMFDYEVHDKLRESYAVKIIGIKGAQWEEEVTRKDTDCEFSVSVRDQGAEEQKTLRAMQKREMGFQRFEKNPELLGHLNSNEYVRTILEDMDLPPEKVSALLDKNNDSDSLSRAEAAQAIQDCLEGKPLYRMYRNATPGFITKITTFCDDNYDLIPADELAKMSPGRRKAYDKEMLEYDKLMAYAEAHIPIAKKNMERKAVSVIATMAANAALAPVPGTQKQPTPNPVAPTV